MASDKFKLPGSSYDELTKIISAYAKANQAESLESIAKKAVMDKTVVSRNNGFLLSAGIIEGGRSKAPTEIGKRLGTALEWDNEQEAQLIWKEIVSENGFLCDIISAVRIRRGMDANTLKGHIAYSAGQPKTSMNITGAGTIVQILQKAGQLTEEDGKFIANLDYDRMTEDESSSTGGGKGNLGSSQQLPANYVITPGQLNIEISIAVTPDDLPTLSSRLKNFLQEFSQMIDAHSDSEGS